MPCCEKNKLSRSAPALMDFLACSIENNNVEHNSKQWSQFIAGQKWKDHYVDYPGLLSQCVDVENRRLNSEKQMMNYIASEVDRVQRSYVMLISELSQKGLFPVNVDAEQLSGFIQDIEAFALVNLKAITQIIFFHDDVSDSKLGPSYYWKLRRDDWLSVQQIEPLLLRLSDLCEVQRERDEDKQAEPLDDKKCGDEATLQRSTFERTSIKVDTRL